MKVIVLALFHMIWNGCDGEESWMGLSKVSVLKAEPCPEAAQYRSWMQLRRRMLNRTHEAFDGQVYLNETLDENIGMVLSIEKEAAGGGYKPYYLFEQPREACAAIMRYCGDNFRTVLRLMGEPEECPVRAGRHAVEGFIMDYEAVPQHILYGRFRTDAYFTKDAANILCLRVYVDVTPQQALDV